MKPTEKARESTAQSILAKRTAPSDVSSAPVRRRVFVVDVTDTEDLFEDDEEDGDNDMPDLQEVSDDEDEEAEEAYQRTKAFGDMDCNVILLFYMHIY